MLIASALSTLAFIYTLGVFKTITDARTIDEEDQYLTEEETDKLKRRHHIS